MPTTQLNIPNNQEIVIYGIGSMAETLYSYLLKNHRILAFVCQDDLCKSASFCDKPLVKYSEFTHRFDNTYVGVAVAVGYLSMNDVRDQVCQQLQHDGFKQQGYIDDDFFFHRKVAINSDSFILNNVTIHCNSSVGRHVFLANGVNVGHDCTIDDFCWVNSGVTLAGGVVLGHHCFLGINASVAQGVKVAPYTFVGANTLVTENTEGGVVVSHPSEYFDIDSKTYLQMLQC